MIPTRRVSSVAFYTPDKKIMLQGRADIRKYGEDWALWGGGREPGETRRQAAIREIKEELDYDLQGFRHIGQVEGKLAYAKSYRKKQGTVRVVADIFAKPVPEDLSPFTLLEGSDIGFFSFEDARNLNLVTVDQKILDVVERYLEEE